MKLVSERVYVTKFQKSTLVDYPVKNEESNNGNDDNEKKKKMIVRQIKKMKKMIKK